MNSQLNENVLICKLCTEKIESFDEFYQEIHKNQQKIEEQRACEQAMVQQKDEIRYIIFLKDNRAEIEIQKVEDEEPNDTDQQLTLLNIPVQELQDVENASQKNTEQTAISKTFADAEDQADLVNSRKSKEENESQAAQLIPMNLKGFPRDLIKDGKLNIKGKELSKLIANFYRLDCDLCSTQKKFRKFSAMLNHYKTEHSIKGFVTCCGMKIIKIRQIAMHMARHIQPEAFKCPTCNKLLTCPKILQYHIQNHLPEQERTLVCPEVGCTRRFSYQSALSAHSISHLPENERTTFSCETCGRKFSTVGRLSAHVNTVHSRKILKKEFTCEICSKSFLCKSNLSYHLTTHKHFEFQVECTICKKWLKNKICLKKHMTIHSEIKHFCDKCEYSAANKQCLMNHKKVQHTDLKPFSCGVNITY